MLLSVDINSQNSSVMQKYLADARSGILATPGSIILPEIPYSVLGIHGSETNLEVIQHFLSIP